MFLLLHQHPQVLPFGMFPVPFYLGGQHMYEPQKCEPEFRPVLQLSTHCHVCPGLNLLLVHSYHGNSKHTLKGCFGDSSLLRPQPQELPPIASSSSVPSIDLPNLLVLYAAQWGTTCEQMHITLCTLSQPIAL